MKGRPPGPAHPLTFFEFWIIYCEQLPEQGTVLGAYEAAERITEAAHGRRRFGSYVSFRNVKSKWMKQRAK